MALHILVKINWPRILQCAVVPYEPSMSSSWKPAGKPAGGFPGQNLETHHLSDFKELESCHLGLQLMTQWAKVTKIFQITTILTNY